MNKQINTEKAPAAIGPYSQAVEANGMVFASGQLPIDPATGAFAEGGVKEQTRQSLTNAKHILEEAGTDLQHVVRQSSVRPESRQHLFRSLHRWSMPSGSCRWHP